MELKKPDFKKVDQKLLHLEQHFDIGNATGSRPNAIALGHELADLAAQGVELFKVADKRLTQIVEKLIGNEMGAVAGAVERSFHDGVSEKATDDLIRRANNESKKERAR